MAHRGPDGSGYLLFNSTDGGFQIGLGHRRLSIIEIGGGGQPMSSEDGLFSLVFNGEIYNYVELHQELVALGHHRFRTNSDTEVLIKSYRAWNLGAINRFRGMFAFSGMRTRNGSCGLGIPLARNHCSLQCDLACSFLDPKSSRC